MLENSHTYFKNLAAKGKITTENYQRKITTEKALRAQICFLLIFSTFKRQPHKMVIHTQATCWQKSTNCLSVFDHFVELALKWLNGAEF